MLEDAGNEKTEFNIIHGTSAESPAKLPRQTTESDVIRDQVNTEINRL